MVTVMKEWSASLGLSGLMAAALTAALLSL